MAFILFLLKYVQAGSNQQKNSSPPPFHPARAPCRAALNRKRPLLGYGRLNHQEGGSVRPMPDAPRRRAEPASVLCGEYSSTLRQVQFRTPQGMLSSARKKKAAPETFPGYGLPSFVSVPSILPCFALLQLQPNGGGVSVSPPPPWLPSSPRPVPGRS